MFPSNIWGFPANFPLNQSIESSFQIHMFSICLSQLLQSVHLDCPQYHRIKGSIDLFIVFCAVPNLPKWHLTLQKCVISCHITCKTCAGQQKTETALGFWTGRSVKSSRSYPTLSNHFTKSPGHRQETMETIPLSIPRASVCCHVTWCLSRRHPFLLWY